MIEGTYQSMLKYSDIPALIIKIAKSDVVTIVPTLNNSIVVAFQQGHGHRLLLQPDQQHFIT